MFPCQQVYAGVRLLVCGGSLTPSAAGFTYRVFAGRQNLLDHHAVPRERAPVQRVGPIGTEGTQAWCG